MAANKVAKKSASINSTPTLKVVKTGRSTPGLVLESPEAVFALLKDELGQADRENFIVLHLNSKNELLASEAVSTGSLSCTTVHPREVFKGALLNNSAAIICVHNHPSGNPEPSPEDQQLTQRLSKAGEVLGVKLLDHVIIGAGRFSRIQPQASTIQKTVHACSCKGNCSGSAANGNLRSELIDLEDCLDQVFYQVRFLRCTDWSAVNTGEAAEGCDIALRRVQDGIQACREKAIAARQTSKEAVSLPVTS